jgi:ribonuclease P protein component
MKKINIIKKNEDFKKIIDMNNCYKNNCLLIHFGSNNLEYYRFGISVSKKIGNAVTRNYYKRVIRNIVDNHKKLYSKGKDYIIILRKACIEMNYSEIEQSFLQLINKIEKESENEK